MDIEVWSTLRVSRDLTSSLNKESALPFSMGIGISFQFFGHVTGLINILMPKRVYLKLLFYKFYRIYLLYSQFVSKMFFRTLSDSGR